MTGNSIICRMTQSENKLTGNSIAVQVTQEKYANDKLNNVLIII